METIQHATATQSPGHLGYRPPEDFLPARNRRTSRNVTFNLAKGHRTEHSQSPRTDAADPTADHRWFAIQNPASEILHYIFLRNIVGGFVIVWDTFCWDSMSGDPEMKSRSFRRDLYLSCMPLLATRAS